MKRLIADIDDDYGEVIVLTVIGNVGFRTNAHTVTMHIANNEMHIKQEKTGNKNINGFDEYTFNEVNE